MLHLLGVFDNWLYLFPQLRLMLLYGARDVEKDAIPDLTVMDILSFLKMVVVQDKRANK